MQKDFRGRRFVSVLAVLVLCGCSGEETPGASGSGTTAPEPGPASAAPAAVAAIEAPDPNQDVCGAHVLVRYAGAEKAGPDVRRIKEEARVHAESLLARIRTSSLEDVARTESEHESSKVRGGLLGTFKRSELPPQMAEGIFSLNIGATSPAPVETPLGYHIFKRLPVEKVRARHILVRYRGAKNDRGATRSKVEAGALARRVRVLAGAAAADFAALAREHSEDTSSERGGDLGEFGRGRMVQAFDAAVFALSPNAVSEVVETEFGFHVIQRLP